MSHQRIARELVGQRMFALTIAGVDLAINELKHSFPGVGIARAAVAATSITQGPAPAVS
jgi:hypothetical protein